MDTGDHPKTDDSDLVDQEQIDQYQMLISSLKWDVILGRYG